MIFKYRHYFACSEIVNSDYYEVIPDRKSCIYLVKASKNSSFMLARLWPCELLLTLCFGNLLFTLHRILSVIVKKDKA